MLVSVIITTKNEEKNMKNILESLKNQTFKDFEVVVVDNKSSDKTKEISKEYGALVFDKGPERSAQRNYGVSKASGKYVLILDADMILEPDVIDECVKKFKEDSDLKKITIKEIPMGEGFWSKCKRLELEFYSKNPKAKTHAARFFEKKVFEEFGGYDPELTGPEDWDLPERISKKYVKSYFTKSVIHHNEGDYGLLRILKKKFYYAKKAHIYVKKSKLKVTDSKFIYFLRPEFYKYYKLWFKNPVVSIGLVFMLTLEFIAGGFGFVLGKIRG